MKKKIISLDVTAANSEFSDHEVQTKRWWHLGKNAEEIMGIEGSSV